jgi:SAM-dependent methyltransferase
LGSHAATGLADWLKDRAPPAARRFSRRIKAVFRGWRNRRMTAQEVFTQIYATKMWGAGTEEFYSGPGSNAKVAKPYADFVINFIAEHNIRTIVDLGCGDFRVGRMIASCGVAYTGVDVVQPLIEENNRRFGNQSIRFQCLDIATDHLPDGQLCLIREVFQHVSNAQISAALAKMTKYNYVLFTDVQPDDPAGYRVNKDKTHGDSSRAIHHSYLRLDSPPFNVKSVQMVFESAPLYLGSSAPKGGSFRLRTFLWKPAAGECAVPARPLVTPPI